MEYNVRFCPWSETLHSPGYVRRGLVVNVNIWAGGLPALLVFWALPM